MLLGLICLSLAGGAATATDTTLYVTGVEAWDVLYLRSKPSLRGRIVGAMPSDAYGITALGMSSDRKWYQVSYHGVTGWASEVYLDEGSGAVPTSPLPGTLCRGNEPFWAFTMAGQATVWEAPEGTRPSPLSDPLAASNRTDLWRLGGDGAIKDAVLRADRRCVDGMSDQRYEYEVYVLHSDGRLLQGCCQMPR